MYDTAHDYILLFDILNITHKDKWHSALLYYHIKNSLNFKTRYPLYPYKIRIRCGEKKLNKIRKEIIFLGYDEDVFIMRKETLSERRKDRNGHGCN